MKRTIKTAHQIMTEPTTDWPFPTIKAFPQGAHLTAAISLWPIGQIWWPQKRFDIEGNIWTGPDDKRLRQFYCFHYAVLLFKQKPYSYMELHGIDPSSEEGRAHLALWMRHRLDGE